MATIISKIINDRLDEKQNLSSQLTDVADLDLTAQTGKFLTVDVDENFNLASIITDSEYSLSFNNNSDWGSAVDGVYTIAIPVSTHGKGATPTIIIQDSSGNYIEVDKLNVSITGDVSIDVIEIPDGRFAGSIIIKGKGIAIGGGGGGGTWGTITGTLSDQLDLQAALDAKQAIITGDNNSFVGLDGTGLLFSLPGLHFDSRNFGVGINSYVSFIPQNNEGVNLHNFAQAIEPNVDTSNDNYTGWNLDQFYDRQNAGFGYDGTITGANLSQTHEGSGTVRTLRGLNMYQSMGNSINIATIVRTGTTAVITTQGNHAITDGTLIGITNTGVDNFNVTSVPITLIDATSFSVEVADSGATTASQGNVHSIASFADELRLVDLFCGIRKLTNANNVSGVRLSFQNDATIGNLDLISIDSQGINNGNFNGISINTQGTVNGGYNGLNINNQCEVNDDLNLVNLTNQGYVDGNFSSINLNLQGEVAGNITAININAGDVISTNKLLKVGLNLNNCGFQQGYEFNTANITIPPSSVFGVNNIGSQFTIEDGFPIDGGQFGFINNIGSSLLLKDDMGPDFTGVGLGLSLNGFVGQLWAAAGITVDTVNFMLAGAGVPDLGIPDNGTITHLNFFRSIGLLPQGGNIHIDNIYGFRADSLLTATNPTNAWGVYIDNTTANNFFNKITLGGDGKTTHPGLAIEIKSNKGIRIGSLTTSEKTAITPPPAGTLIFDSGLHKLCVYSGSAWETITSV